MGDHAGKASGLRRGPHQRAQPHRAHQLWQVFVCDGKNGEEAIWVQTGHLGQEFLKEKVCRGGSESEWGHIGFEVPIDIPTEKPSWWLNTYIWARRCWVRTQTWYWHTAGWKARRVAGTS